MTDPDFISKAVEALNGKFEKLAEQATFGRANKLDIQLTSTQTIDNMGKAEYVWHFTHMNFSIYAISEYCELDAELENIHVYDALGFVFNFKGGGVSAYFDVSTRHAMLSKVKRSQDKIEKRYGDKLTLEELDKIKQLYEFIYLVYREFIENYKF